MITRWIEGLRLRHLTALFGLLLCTLSSLVGLVALGLGMSWQLSLLVAGIVFIAMCLYSALSIFIKALLIVRKDSNL